jgi:hypothetical protein
MRHVGPEQGMTSLVRALACSLHSLCGGLGLLFMAVTPFGPDDVTTAPGIPDAGAAGPGGISGRDGDAACIDQSGCIERHLWSVYARTPKLDGGIDFAWKDAHAAEKAGMSLREYAIGGMNPFFRVTLYRALRMLDAAGFSPGITCGFRDDYRQSITSGRMKAQNDRSFHGGSFRGGYGYGMAADIVSLRGRTVAERATATGHMWDWIDRHEKELGIGRPYLRRDPPHVAPIDGEEYAAHRILPNARGAASKTLRRPPLAAPGVTGTPKRAGTVNSVTGDTPGAD